MKFRQLQVVQLLQDAGGADVRDVMAQLDCSRRAAGAALLQLYKSGRVVRNIVPAPGGMTRYTYRLFDDEK